MSKKKVIKSKSSGKMTSKKKPLLPPASRLTRNAATKRKPSAIQQASTNLSADKVQTQIDAFFNNRRHPLGTLPDLAHIMTFFEEPSSDGGNLMASTVEEAYMMAYVEKNMGSYSYQGLGIWEYDLRNGKRDALMKLVKENGANFMINDIAPVIT